VADNSDWLAVTYNLKKARCRWAQVSHILTKQHIDPRMAGFFYKAVVQSILLYGCETWSLSRQSITALEGFHNQVARKIARQTIHPDPNTGTWIYPPAEATRVAASLFSIQHYIRTRIAYIMNRNSKNKFLQVYYGEPFGSTDHTRSRTKTDNQQTDEIWNLGFH
jgi:hypothetical protein